MALVLGPEAPRPLPLVKREYKWVVHSSLATYSTSARRVPARVEFTGGRDCIM
jgi:hypothetical protein